MFKSLSLIMLVLAATLPATNACNEIKCGVQVAACGFECGEATPCVLFSSFFFFHTEIHAHFFFFFFLFFHLSRQCISCMAGMFSECCDCLGLCDNGGALLTTATNTTKPFLRVKAKYIF